MGLTLPGSIFWDGWALWAPYIDGFGKQGLMSVLVRRLTTCPPRAHGSGTLTAKDTQIPAQCETSRSFESNYNFISIYVI